MVMILGRREEMRCPIMPKIIVKLYNRGVKIEEMEKRRNKGEKEKNKKQKKKQKKKKGKVNSKRYTPSNEIAFFVSSPFSHSTALDPKSTTSTLLKYSEILPLKWSQLELQNLVPLPRETEKNQNKGKQKKLLFPF